MKKLVIIFTTLFYFGVYSQGYQFEWGSKSLGGTFAYDTHCASDSSENLYLTGSFDTDEISFGSYTLTNPTPGLSKIYLAKYDKNGNVLWAKNFGDGDSDDYASEITTDRDGNILLAVFYNSNTISFGSFNLSIGDGLQASAVVKLNSEGEVIWAKSLTNPQSVRCDYIKTDINQNIYISGYFNGLEFTFASITMFALGDNNDTEAFVAKFDPDGNEIWARASQGNESEHSSDLTIDHEGDVYCSGRFSSDTVNFGDLTILNNGTVNFYLVKYDSSGNELWAKAFGGTGPQDLSEGVAVDEDLNSYLAAIWQSSSIVIGTETLNNNADGNLLLIKLDPDGNVVWSRYTITSNYNNPLALTIDTVSERLTIGGYYVGNLDFGGVQLGNANGIDSYLAEYDFDGNAIRASAIGGAGDQSLNTFCETGNDAVYVTGGFTGSADLDPSTHNFNVSSGGQEALFCTKWITGGVTGNIYLDLDQDCVYDVSESRLGNQTVLINPGNIVVQTNVCGVWVLDSLAPGDYTISADTTEINWIPTCPDIQSFTVIDPAGISFAANFGFVSSTPCVSPSETVVMPFMRPCFTDQTIYVQAYNTADATAAILDAYSIVALDPNLIFENASLPYTDLGNNQYRFNHGDINPNQVIDFTISAQVACEVEIGQTICLEAVLYPISNCALDTTINALPNTVSPCYTEYDNSHLLVRGACINDSIVFTITNTGGIGVGDMSCYTPVNVYIDGVLFLTDSVKLNGAQSAVFSFLGDGRTWRLEAFQHPLHPGNSFPNATVENCNPGSWTPELVTILPEDDADPHVSIYCDVASASYDPNDKRGFPSGVSSENFIASNQDLEYIIRFQNTGTDTAFTIVVRDTLDMDLNIFTVNPGAASHPYTFRMYGPRVLEWTFNRILLPDSTTNEFASHGFASFSVAQNPNLAEGTVISNDADIYFDFNEPIITNETQHKINYQYNKVNKVQALSNKTSEVKIYPNPSTALFYISTNTKFSQASYKITNLSGKLIETKSNLSGQQFQVDLTSQAKGIYFLELTIDGKSEVFKLIKE